MQQRINWGKKVTMETAVSMLQDGSLERQDAVARATASRSPERQVLLSCPGNQHTSTVSCERVSPAARTRGFGGPGRVLRAPWACTGEQSGEVPRAGSKCGSCEANEMVAVLRGEGPRTVLEESNRAVFPGEKLAQISLRFCPPRGFLLLFLVGSVCIRGELHLCRHGIQPLDAEGKGPEEGKAGGLARRSSEPLAPEMPQQPGDPCTMLLAGHRRQPLL